MRTTTRTMLWIGLLCLITMTLAVSFPLRGLANSYDWTIIDVPGATESLAFSINSHCQIVGTYLTDTYHAYLLDSGGFTTLDIPGPSKTTPSTSTTPVKSSECT